VKVKILDFLSERGVLLEPDAMNYLLKRENPLEHLDNIWKNINQDNIILSMRDILAAEEIAHIATRTKVSSAKEFQPEFRILRQSPRSSCEGKLEDFTQYFKSRFASLKRLLGKRRELISCIEIAKVKKVTGSVKFIGIVNSVTNTKNGHRILELEDEKERIKALIPKDSELISDPMVQDEVVGIVGSRSKDLVIVENVVRPGHPVDKTFKTAANPLLAVFISDIHVGSKHFLYDPWKGFSSWLRSEPMVKYIVVTGDLIDGVGIYPKQEEDLLIADTYSQYEELSKLFNEIPRHIKVILMPGNHDAVRPAEPQPPLSSELKGLFKGDVEFVGNPSLFQIDGVKVLAYHGRSMDDFVSQMLKASYERPLEIMKAMLQKRHLAPVYGGKTPISPEKEDCLVIDRIPDIFVTGHVHAAGLESFRGIKLINASTWQSQTDYQKMRNMLPEPCKVPVVNLGTGEAWLNDFLA
jgi:DNA polymerase II small subunit